MIPQQNPGLFCYNTAKLKLATDLPQPKLNGINHDPDHPVSELAAKPPQKPAQKPAKDQESSSSSRPSPTMDDPDPWNTPDVHKGHNHAETHHDVPGTPESDDAPHSGGGPDVAGGAEGSDDGDSFPSVSMSTPAAAPNHRSISAYTEQATSPSRHHHNASASQPALPVASAAGWGGYYETAGSPGGFGEPANPFGSNRRFSAGAGAGAGVGGAGGNGSGGGPPLVRATSGRTGNALEEVVSVVLMPEKEGFFLFQHHNYEVSSSRRGSKVVRRYSDFVWLLECLHKRYPFRALPPLPPKRVAGEFSYALHILILLVRVYRWRGRDL